MLKIKELPNGSIVWKKSTILGVKGATLDERYFDYYCIKIPNNDFDYEIAYSGTLKELKQEVEEVSNE